MVSGDLRPEAQRSTCGIQGRDRRRQAAGGRRVPGDHAGQYQKERKIAVSASNGASLEGYQIKGTAGYVTEGPIVETFKKQVETMFKGAATAKGALIITPEKVIVTTPGADNKKEL